MFRQSIIDRRILNHHAINKVSYLINGWWQIQVWFFLLEICIDYRIIERHFLYLLVAIIRRMNTIIPRLRNDQISNTKPSYFNLTFPSRHYHTDSTSQIVAYLLRIERLCESHNTDESISPAFIVDKQSTTTICSINVSMEQAFRQPTLVCKRLPVISMIDENCNILWCV